MPTDLAPLRSASGLARRTWLRVWLASLMGLALAGCGYAVGSPYSAEIRSVYVPAFTSQSPRRGLEFQLTEAVQKQIQLRTPFRLTSEEYADTKLTGRLVSADKTVLGETRNDDARELQWNVVVEVTWEDARSGEILAQQRVPIRPDVVALTTQSSFAPEVGQSLATAQTDAVNQIARQIVNMMESPWSTRPANLPVAP